MKDWFSERVRENKSFLGFKRANKFMTSLSPVKGLTVASCRPQLLLRSTHRGLDSHKMSVVAGLQPTPTTGFLVS